MANPQSMQSMEDLLQAFQQVAGKLNVNLPPMGGQPGDIVAAFTQNLGGGTLPPGGGRGGVPFTQPLEPATQGPAPYVDPNVRQPLESSMTGGRTDAEWIALGNNQPPVRATNVSGAPQGGGPVRSGPLPGFNQGGAMNRDIARPSMAPAQGQPAAAAPEPGSLEAYNKNIQDQYPPNLSS